MAGIGRASAAAVAIAIVAALPCSAAAYPLEGVVTRVTDGDTLWLRPAHGGRPVKVRVRGIDAPERCQPWGPESKQALEALVLGRSVHVDGDLHDDHGRRLGRLMRGDEDLGARMVRNGHAWSPGFRGRDGPYAREERVARAARRGLFADERAIVPREFRRRHGPCE